MTHCQICPHLCSVYMAETWAQIFSNNNIDKSAGAPLHLAASLQIEIPAEPRLLTTRIFLLNNLFI